LIDVKFLNISNNQIFKIIFSNTKFKQENLK